jgi:hypothetical protein
MDKMKQDRFLIGILIGIVALVVISLGLFFLRKDSENYVAENAPENIVHNYVVAIHKGDFEKAYSYLSEGVNKPTYEVFRKAFITNMVSSKNVGLEIGSADVRGDNASVSLNTIYNAGDPFSGGYRNNDVALLIKQNGQWKLEQMPYNFWAYDWYQPTPMPVKP